MHLLRTLRNIDKPRPRYLWLVAHFYSKDKKKCQYLNIVAQNQKNALNQPAGKSKLLNFGHAQAVELEFSPTVRAAFAAPTKAK